MLWLAVTASPLLTRAARAAGAPAPTGAAAFQELTLDVPADGGSQKALVLIPEHLDPAARHPLVVLLHGYSQARSTARALHAWQREYAIETAYARLRAPPIRRTDESLRFLSDRRIDELDATLAERPFQGLVLACPVTPIPYFVRRAAPLFQRYADWIDGALLPAVRAVAPVSHEAAATGIAGHSMGGQVALEVLSRKPASFAALSGLQMAIEPRQASGYARRLAEAFASTAPPALQIQTTTRDLYRDANRALGRALAERGIVSELHVPFGTHTAGWVRETGALEALLFFDRALRTGSSAA